MLREPASNLEAEQQVLGAILMRNEVYHDICGDLKPEHFFDEEHAVLYASMGRLLNNGRKVTPASLKGEIEDGTYLGKLALQAPTAAIGRDMARVVRDTALRRELVLLAQDVAQKASVASSDTNVTDLIEGLEANLLSLVGSGATDRQVSLADALNDAIEMVNAAYQRDTGMIGLPTGLTALDRLTGGLVDSELIVLAGRPSMGKSALAANIALHAAKQGTAVGFFTVEMSAQQLALRILAEQANVSSHRMRQGRIQPEEFDRLMDEASRLLEANIQFDETGGVSVEKVRSVARRWKRKHDIGLLVVDYLQLMSGVKKGANRVGEITEITTGLKAIAKDLNIPVLALSQLSRAVEQRDDKRPQLSDLRESGSIEQDADVVMFVFREEYYIERREPKEGTDAHGSWYAELMAAKGKADVIIGKQRHGPCGTVTLQFNPEFTKFSDAPVQAWREAAE